MRLTLGAQTSFAKGVIEGTDTAELQCAGLLHQLASRYSLALMRVVLTLLILALFLPSVSRAQTNSPDVTAAKPELVLALTVTPLQQEMFHRAPASARPRELMGRYYKSVRLWGVVLGQRFQAVPGKPGCAYYGDGGNLENDIRPLAYAVLVNAFLATTEPPAGKMSATERRRTVEDCVQVLRYLAQGHVTGAGVCVNGKRWGDHWQSAFWARSAVLAGWLAWKDLEPELREGLCRVLAHEADRFLRQKPKSSLKNDTGAEENAWNAQLLSLASLMLPTHPHAAQWDQRAKLYCYNSLSVAADSVGEQAADDNRLVRDWVCTTNAHADFTVDNHGIVHLGYLKTTLSMLLENSLPYLLTGTAMPKASLHHVSEGFEVLLRCMAWDGAPIYFSGNDWKITHTQATDTMSYGLMSLLLQNRQAAYLEQVGLDYLLRIQKQEQGYYNVRRDLESSGHAATRLIAAYYGHALLGAGAEPLSPTEFDRSVSGTCYLPEGCTILHRTPSKFASFTWGQKRMALTVPRDGNWVVWPHFSSGPGLINGQDASARYAALRDFTHQVTSNSFTVSGVFDRYKGAVQQAFFFTSLPSDITVYIERLRRQKGFALHSRETGVIGLEYEFRNNHHTLCGQHGTLATLGVGGDKAGVVELPTDWLNISDRIGYVVRRFPATQNVMRFHDEIGGKGRTPKLEEWLSLIGEKDAQATPSDSDWACLVSFANQKKAPTRQQADKVQFRVEGDTAVCCVGGREIRATLAFPSD
jgi:hypothetical protein